MAFVNRAVAAALGIIPEGILWLFARRYVAGATLAEAVQAVRDLNARGLLATPDILGEHVASPAEARADGAAYGGILGTIQREGLASNTYKAPSCQ